jgi:hypothetical protein
MEFGFTIVVVLVFIIFASMVGSVGDCRLAQDSIAVNIVAIDLQLGLGSDDRI